LKPVNSSIGEASRTSGCVAPHRSLGDPAGSQRPFSVCVRFQLRDVCFKTMLLEGSPMKMKRPTACAAGRFSFELSQGCRLPVSAAVRAATCCEAATCGAATCCEATACGAAAERAACCAANWAASNISRSATGETGTAVEARATCEARASAVEAVAVVAAAEPGAGADEDAAGEVAWSIVAVRRAGVRSIAVVAVSADGRCADVNSCPAEPHADRDSLCVRVRGGNHAEAKYRENS
jgi:hypothetical protein